MKVSGKLVIIAILALALAAAGASWWFRYNSTRRAVQFWTPTGARLIRDAPDVGLHKGPLKGLEPASIQANFTAATIDISHARGLVHLRNALLQDRSFDWSTPREPQPLLLTNGDLLYWRLMFDEPTTGKSIAICFSEDCRWARWADDDNKDHVISTEPIAPGLREMFVEYTPQAAEDSTIPASR